MNPYLSDEQIAEITYPLTQGAARCRFLQHEYGLKVKRKPNGQPLVGRVEFDQVMTARRMAKPPENAPPRPDFGKLRGMGKSKLQAVN